MATRTNPTETEKRLATLEADVATLARLAVTTHGMKPSIAQIIQRHAPEAFETRPHQAPERREAAV